MKRIAAQSAPPMGLTEFLAFEVDDNVVEACDRCGKQAVVVANFYDNERVQKYRDDYIPPTHQEYLCKDCYAEAGPWKS